MQWAPVGNTVFHEHNSTTLVNQDTACSTNTFWFPFAFKKSAFLNHYHQLFASPDVLIPLYLRSSGELRSLALERSLETIQCVESRLASPDASSATSDNVLDAVLALICYNVSLVMASVIGSSEEHVAEVGLVYQSRF